MPLLIVTFITFQMFLSCGKVLMQCALMWIALYAQMKASMNLQNFVGLEKLLQNGLLGWLSSFILSTFNSFDVVERKINSSLWFCFDRAMGGSVSFEEALAARLSLFKPSLAQVQEFLEKRPPRYECCNYSLDCTLLCSL